MQAHRCRVCREISYSAADPEDSLYGCPLCGNLTETIPFAATPSAAIPPPWPPEPENGSGGAKTGG